MSTSDRDQLVAEAERLEREHNARMSLPVKEAIATRTDRERFWYAHAGTLLSLLASEGAKVKELEAKVEQQGRTIGRLALPDIEYRDKLRSQAMAAEDLAESLKADRDRLTAEVERLKGCLATANANHEKFERQWYLEQDAREKAEAEVTRLTARWDALSKWLAICQRNFMGPFVRKVREKMAELEAQR